MDGWKCVLRERERERETMVTLGMNKMSRQHIQASTIINTDRPYAASIKNCVLSTRLSGAVIPMRITTMYMATLTKQGSFNT